MIKYRRLVGALALVGMCFPLCAFNGGFMGCFGSSQPLMSMHVQDTQYRDGILVGAQPRPAQQVWGSWNYDLANPTGSVKAFGWAPGAFTGTNGRYDVANARLNANWSLQAGFNPPCYQTYPTEDVISLLLVVTDVPTTHHDPTFECKTDIYDNSFVLPGFILSSAVPGKLPFKQMHSLLIPDLDLQCCTFMIGTATPMRL